MYHAKILFRIEIISITPKYLLCIHTFQCQIKLCCDEGKGQVHFLFKIKDKEEEKKHFVDCARYKSTCIQSQLRIWKKICVPCSLDGSPRWLGT